VPEPTTDELLGRARSLLNTPGVDPSVKQLGENVLKMNADKPIFLASFVAGMERKLRERREAEGVDSGASEEA